MSGCNCEKPRKNKITKKNINKVDKIITLAVGAGDECEFFEELE